MQYHIKCTGKLFLNLDTSVLSSLPYSAALLAGLQFETPGLPQIGQSQAVQSSGSIPGLPFQDKPLDAEGAFLRQRIQAEALLGKDGRSLQYVLHSELKAEMQWHYILLCMSCNSYGQPTKVNLYFTSSLFRCSVPPPPIPSPRTIPKASTAWSPQKRSINTSCYPGAAVPIPAESLVGFMCLNFPSTFLAHYPRAFTVQCMHQM